MAKAAYFPQLTLSASGGAGAAALGSLFDTPGRVWSLGAALAQAIFDGGLRTARVAQAEAAYDISVAQYKQTVLGAFQQVEDQLALLRLLEQESTFQDQAVRSSQQAQQLALAQYRAGTATYLNVVTTQTTLLATSAPPCSCAAAARRQHHARLRHRRRLERLQPARRRAPPRPRSRNDPTDAAMTTTFTRNRTTWALVAVAVAVLGARPLVDREAAQAADDSKAKGKRPPTARWPSPPHRSRRRTCRLPHGHRQRRPHMSVTVKRASTASSTRSASPKART